MRAIAGKAPKGPFTPEERRQIGNAYREFMSTFNGNFHGGKFSEYLEGFRQGRLEAEVSTHTVPMRSHYLHMLFDSITDPPSRISELRTENIASIRLPPTGAAKLLSIVKAAENVQRYAGNSARWVLEAHLAAQYLLGKAWNYDRVALDVYKSKNGAIRKYALNYARKNPQDAQWLIDTIQKYTWQPKQLNLDLSGR